MSVFAVYQDYVALKNHFSKPNYDYFKYNGKTGVKKESFDARKDRLFFEKVAKRQDYHDFFVANLCENSKLWIKDLAYSEEANKKFAEWKKKHQSLSYFFKNELSKLNDNFDSNFSCKNQHPILLKLYLSGELSLETLCILLDLTGAIKDWDKKMEYDPIWDEISLKVKKYIPFIRYDKEKFKKIVLDKYS